MEIPTCLSCPDSSVKQMDNKSGIDSDLGLQNFSSSKDPLMVVDATDFGSCGGPLERKDPMKLWQEMKKNGFLSPSLGQNPTTKKPHKRQNSCLRNRKIKVPKVEKVDTFTSIGAPNGLLGELNPGIINRVRSSEQVLSVIEALVNRGEFEEVDVCGKQTDQMKKRIKENIMVTCSKDVDEGRGHFKILNGPLHMNSEQGVGVKRVEFEEHDVDGKQANQMKKRIKENIMLTCSNSFSDDDEGRGHSMILNGPLHMNSEQGVGFSTMEAVRSVEYGDNKDKLCSLSSVNEISEHSSSMRARISSPSEAATVLSQWLQLLHHDISGRPAALRHSRMRVQGVIQTELPLLISKEFSPDQKNYHSAAGCYSTTTMNMHQAMWNSLFSQMDKVLYEEENLLEVWLNQVIEMQSCRHNANISSSSPSGVQGIQLHAGITKVDQ